MTKRRTREAAVVEGVEAAEKQNGRGTVTLSSGIRLAVRPVSRHFIYEVTARFDKPEVPTWVDPEKGREGPNPEDPGYIKAAEQYVVDVANATTDVALLRGTQVLEIPDGVHGPDSPEWREEMEFLGLELVNNSRARYLSWLKAVAMPMDDDINRVLSEVGRLIGASEDDVTEAVQRFRRITPRDKDQPAPA